MRSIRTMITAITIIAILTSILSVFTVSYLIIQRETDQNSVGMMNLIDQDTQKSLERDLASIEQSVEITANVAVDDLDSVLLVENGAVRIDSQSQTQTPKQIAALDSYLHEYLGNIQSIFSGVADYTDGVTAYYYCINPEISRDEHGFYFMKVGKTGFVEQPPLDVQDLDFQKTLNATWYDAAVSRGYPTWIGPYKSEKDPNVWIYTYSVPIYKAGMLIGIMGMNIPCDTLTALIGDIHLYDTGFVCLLDAEGRVIYHPNLPFGSDLDELGLSITSEILQKKTSGDELIRYKVGNEEHQMSFSTLSNGMKLLVIAPSSEINAPWISLIRIIALVAAAVIIFYVILVMVLMGITTYPLKQLTDASQRLADADDYDVELNYHGNNEIGTLTGSFNRMREQIKQYIGDLNYQLYHDRLTDLPNMRHFLTLAEDEKKRLLAEGKQPVIVYFDIVGLRNYNRRYGFKKGDELIVNFAKILERQFGDHRVCRFSGDHFDAVTDETRVEEEIQVVLRECETVMDGKQMLVRVGVYPNRLEDVEINIACDRAKFAGELKRGELSSTVTYYDEKLLRDGEIYTHIINNLDRALSEGWIKVYYQPIIRAADEKICDEEALTRWIDPVLGFLSPGDFIPALEESKLIYKLDLYVVDQVLAKMKQQVEAGFYLVPQSINLSRMDFESCDVVEEIRRRVDEAGIDRSMISVEITESVIGGDFEFMKEQVNRFRHLGFRVWMDDFGTGYSSLDVLHQIHFDLIKFDMWFMERFDEGEESRIILTELMNMAIALGIETICEGVEQVEQVEFLREIGCTRIQGFYYGKPLPFEGILNLFEKGTRLEFENPEESAYYSSIGRINLYDISALSNENDDSLTHYFNILPMSIIEVNGTKLRYNRCNRSYRDFMLRTLGINYDTEEVDTEDPSSRIGQSFLNAVVQCGRDGSRSIIDEKVSSDTEIHSLIRRVAVNPVTGTAAVAVAVLAVIKRNENDGTNYSQMAKALAADYADLYYVNLDSEKFIHYRPDTEHENLVMEQHGENFFANARRDALQYIYKEDQENFQKVFTKQNIVNALDTEKNFKVTYRLMHEGGEPYYVEMKAVRMPDDPSHIMVGVNNVDSQMREKETLSRIQTERIVYSRINALEQRVMCIYTIDPDTGHYIESRASSDYVGLGIPTEGDDFFAQSQKESERYIYPEDLSKFRMLLTRENFMAKLETDGFFSFNYRMLLEGEPRYMNLKAALIEEQDKPVLVIGVDNIDAQVRQEQAYERKLFSARSKAHLDTLTGVKDKIAYKNMSDHLTRQIAEGQNVKYAIVLCRVNNIPQIIKTEGKPAGDQLILDACEIICDVFKHSPVFRVAGDMFAVIAQGHDYDCAEDLVIQLSEICRNQSLSVSRGMAKYDGSESISTVFANAERLCRKI